MLGRGALAPLSFHSMAEQRWKVFMSSQTDLRAFLSRQKDIPYCLECLRETGMFHISGGAEFTNECCEMVNLAATSLSAFPTALMFTRGCCHICSAPRVCIVFPGRIVNQTESQSSLAEAETLKWLVTAAHSKKCWPVIYDQCAHQF